MKTIRLNTGEIVKYDDEDHVLLMKYKWRRTSTPSPYAITYLPETQKNALMHRIIMNVKQGLDVDHINGNGCDNRKSNLRIVSRSRNQQAFIRKKKNPTSQYRGVVKHFKCKGWTSTIGKRINGKFHNLVLS